VKQDTKRKALAGLSAVALAIVVVAPAAASWHGLVATGRDLFHLGGGWEYLVPLTLDGAALYSGALAIRAILAGDSAFGARLLTALYAVGAASFNAFHARTAAGGNLMSALFFAGASLSAVVLWDVTLRALRRDQLRDLGAIEAPLPRFRLLRWVVDLPMTARAWRVAVIEQISDPTVALQRARELRGMPAVPMRTAVAERITTTDVPALDVAQDDTREDTHDEQGADDAAAGEERDGTAGEALLGSGAAGGADVRGEEPGVGGERGAHDVGLVRHGDDGVRDVPAGGFRLSGGVQSKADAVRAAFDHLGGRDIPGALALLAEQGVSVDRSYAYTVKWQPKTAELRALPGGAR
jgi:Protein of unknown function (DUF2637)